jgi:hypothetical protein
VKYLQFIFENFLSFLENNVVFLFTKTLPFSVSPKNNCSDANMEFHKTAICVYFLFLKNTQRFPKLHADFYKAANSYFGYSHLC